MFSNYCKKLNMEFSDSTACDLLSYNRGNKKLETLPLHEFYFLVKKYAFYKDLKEKLENKIAKRFKYKWINNIPFVTNLNYMMTAKQLCGEYIDGYNNPESIKRHIKHLL